MIKNRWKLTILAAAVALGLAACSGGNGKEAAKDAPTDRPKKEEVKTEAVSKYPQKPIVVVAPSGAGGGWDMTARSIAKVMGATKLVDQPITVENKPGGGGAVFLAEYATKDKNNDFELMVSSPPILINNLKSEGNSPYGYKDTTPLAQLTKDFGAIAVKADSKFKDLQSVIEALKADPSQVTVVGGSAPGSMDHLVAVLPAFKAGVDPKKVKYVSYDGGGEALTALLGGNADVLGTDASSLAEYLKAGKIRVLAVESPERLDGILKDVPTLKELGFDAEFAIWRGIFGPKEMSADAKKYWLDKLKEMSDSDGWANEVQAKGWAKEFRSGDDFNAFLGQQEILVKDMLTSLGMAKQ